MMKFDENLVAYFFGALYTAETDKWLEKARQFSYTTK